MAMIEANQLKKAFGHIHAVNGVSFSVEQGEALGFLGPNGAGKTTVMRMLTTFITPTSGSAKVGGHDVVSQPMEARRRIGYLPESNPVYGDMTVLSFLDFIGQMRRYSSPERKRRIDKVVGQCWLESVRHQTLETLSKGYKRRVGLAQALLHDPPVLILDEPTDGLDPNQKFEVRKLIKDMSKKKAIIVSTHILEEVDAVCSRAIVIADGAIAADDQPSKLKARSERHNAVRLVIAAAEPAVGKDDFKRIGEIDKVETFEAGDKSAGFVVIPRDGLNIAREVMALAHDKNWAVEHISVEQGDLNEVFRSITMKEGSHS